VEAFRQSLKRSGRRDNQLPTRGFGHGMLNVPALLAVDIKTLNLEYAYNNWNEHAFFATLQASGEIVKTYWNRIHDRIFGSRHGNQESMGAVTESMPLSEAARMQESVLFGGSRGLFEADTPAGKEELVDRFNVLADILQQSAQRL